MHLFISLILFVKFHNLGRYLTSTFAGLSNGKVNLFDCLWERKKLSCFIMWPMFISRLSVWVSSLLTGCPLAPQLLFKRLNKYKFERITFYKTPSALCHLHLYPVLTVCCQFLLTLCCCFPIWMTVSTCVSYRMYEHFYLVLFKAVVSFHISK